jgi:hypothetical protein
MSWYSPPNLQSLDVLLVSVLLSVAMYRPVLLKSTARTFVTLWKSNTGDCEDSSPTICLPDSSIIVVISTLVYKTFSLQPHKALHFYLQRGSSEHSSTCHNFISPPICWMYCYRLQLKMGYKKNWGSPLAQTNTISSLWMPRSLMEFGVTTQY